MPNAAAAAAAAACVCVCSSVEFILGIFIVVVAAIFLAHVQMRVRLRGVQGSAKGSARVQVRVRVGGEANDVSQCGMEEKCAEYSRSCFVMGSAGEGKKERRRGRKLKCPTIKGLSN